MNKFWLSSLICSLFLTTGSFAQSIDSGESFNESDTVSTTNINIGEVIVSSLRMDRKIRKLPATMSVAGAFDYKKNLSMTLSDVLKTKPGIAMKSDGIWATGINIRGLDENRLVILVDGNRVETATDLTASLSMTDINDIERVEVIKGAQSSLYGTGAMGGIVNIITKDGYFKDNPFFSANIISGYTSGNNLVSNHAAVSTGAGKWYLRVSGTYADAGDMNTPMGILPNSRFTTNNLSAKAGIKPFKNHQLKIQYQRNRSSDVGIPGGEAFPGPAEAKYSDIGRHLFNAGYEITDISDNFSSLQLSYFTQYILRDVSMKPNTVTEAALPNNNIQRTTPVLVTPTGEHLTTGAQLRGTWNFTEKNTFIAGVDVWGRKLTTSREKYIRVDILNPAGQIIKTNNMERGETPIPESRFNSAGLYFQDEASLIDGRLTLITGGRIDRVWINNEQGFDVDYLIVNGDRNDSPPTQRLTFKKGSEQSSSWSANAGLLYSLGKDADASMNLARSFRAPSLEERFKYIDLGNFVQLGDPSLMPESGYSADLGIRVWNPAFTLQSGIFMNAITNMISEIPGEFIFTLTSESKPDTLPALISTNLSKALLYGFDFSFDYNFVDNFVLFASGAYVRGKNRDSGENLPRIPPLNGHSGIRYTYPKLGSTEIAITSASKQEKIAPGERSTGGYYSLSMALHTIKFKIGNAGLQFFSGIDNITNRSYTNHLSTNRGSISIEPGRSAFIRVALSY